MSDDVLGRVILSPLASNHTTARANYNTLDILATTRLRGGGTSLSCEQGADPGPVLYDVMKPIQLIKPGTRELLANVLVEIRARHEPRFVTQAVRRARVALGEGATACTLPAASEGPRTPTLREKLVQHLVTIKQEAQRNTARANRQIRHTGSYTASSQPSTREVQKRTLKAVAASVSTTACHH